MREELTSKFWKEERERKSGELYKGKVPQFTSNWLFEETYMVYRGNDDVFGCHFENLNLMTDGNYLGDGGY